MPLPANPRDTYAARLTERGTALSAEEGRHVTFGNVRIGVFLLTVGMLFAVYARHWFSAWWLMLPVAVLIVMGRRLQHVENRIARLNRSIAFYQQGLDRLDDRWVGKGEDGAAFLDEDHLYASDLDVLGHGSLFQRICVARTERGLATLADWLLTRASIEAVLARHDAVRELAPRLGLREDLAVAGERAHHRGGAAALITWSAEPARAFSVAGQAASWILSILGVFAVLAGATYLIARAGLLAIDDVTLTRLLTYFVVVGSICFTVRWRARRWVDPILQQVFRAEHDLTLIADILARLEGETFESSYLASLRALFVTDHRPASSRIAQLKRYVELLNTRRNQIMRMLAPLLLWDVHLARAIETWRRDSGRSIGEWLRGIGEFEAVASLSAFAWERPDTTLPEFCRDEGPFFDAAGIQHPLLPVSRAVPNDVRLTTDERVLVVSGSNMSGKSTLLRTVGIAAVMAQAGGPVCARHLRLSSLVVGSSIRIQDSLRDGTSRFYAEVSRLSKIMAASRGPVPVLFLIDEILHGTNSHDRLIGAEAVVKGLVEHGAIGLITTHDLALTRVAETPGSTAVNVHFQDYLEEGRMRFDYRMRPGVVQHSNALALMRAVGLDV
jgi:hypothetical protein